jgi:hypothetical protein
LTTRFKHSGLQNARVTKLPRLSSTFHCDAASPVFHHRAFDGADHTLNVRLQASGPSIRVVRVDKIAQSTVGEGNAAITECVGQGFWDQEAPGKACLSVIQKHYWKLKLGMVAMFTAILAAVIGLLMNARSVEILAQRLLMQLCWWCS